MKQDGNTKKQLGRLENVLNVFGADPNRWPAAKRDVLEDLVRTDKSAAKLLDEAEALMRVMDTAPARLANTALRTRIAAAALDDPTRDATVVPLAPKRGQTGRTFPIRRAVSMWPAAALAASFAFGLYMGISGFGGVAVESVFQVATTEYNGNDIDSVSWLEESTGADEEGLL